MANWWGQTGWKIAYAACVGNAILTAIVIFS